jgi:hypothetical protein
MSMAAKEALIKSVGQSLINYIMSIFKLPPGFHEDYMKTIRKFWWGEDKEERKVHCVSRISDQRVQRPSGLGIAP